MHSLLLSKSTRPGVDRWNKFLCVGINFVYKVRTGEITDFIYAEKIDGRSVAKGRFDFILNCSEKGFGIREYPGEDTE